MRWKLPEPPMVGDRKTVKRFAWRPTKMSDRTVVWLEIYIDEYEFDSIYGDRYWRLVRRSDKITFAANRLKGK